MTRRELIRTVAAAGVYGACSSATLAAALEGCGGKTLVIGASKRGCELALADPKGVILVDRGILPAIELGDAETDVWAKKLLKGGCRVLLNVEVESVAATAAGFRVTAFAADGLHVFEVGKVVDATADGWHKGEFR